MFHKQLCKIKVVSEQSDKKKEGKKRGYNSAYFKVYVNNSLVYLHSRILQFSSKKSTDLLKVRYDRKYDLLRSYL